MNNTKPAFGRGAGIRTLNEGFGDPSDSHFTTPLSLKHRATQLLCRETIPIYRRKIKSRPEAAFEGLFGLFVFGMNFAPLAELAEHQSFLDGLFVLFGVITDSFAIGALKFDAIIL